MLFYIYISESSAFIFIITIW